VLGALHGYLEDRSSIVKTFALQGMADLAWEDAELAERVVETLRSAERTGTAAMKTRSQKLLAELERQLATSGAEAVVVVDPGGHG
jgi:hypothetical protein